MIVTVSPYHLTTREPPAYAALLLARRVVTLLPAPEGGPDGARALAGQSRTYADFARSWSWTAPLWRSGLIVAGESGARAIDELPDAEAMLRDDDRYAALRSFDRRGTFEDEAGFLAALAADVLKAGPDPGLALPVATALDRHAARHGLLSARSEPVSPAQHAELEFATPLGALSLPVLAQADAQRLLNAREVLLPALRPWWDAVAAFARGGPDPQADFEAVEHAARHLREAFEGARPRIFAGSGDDDVRPVEGAAALRFVSLPCDAALRSGVLAARRHARLAPVEPNATTLPVRSDPLEGRSLVGVVVRLLGGRARPHATYTRA